MPPYLTHCCQCWIENSVRTNQSVTADSSTTYRKSKTSIFLPEGLFVWATLKYRCPKYVRRRRRRTDFSSFCHRVEPPVTRFLGGTVKASAKSWNLGTVHFFHLPWRCVPRDVSKTHFSEQKIHEQRRSFENDRFVDLFCRFSLFCELFKRRPHKMAWGPPLPCGCNLVDH